MKCRYDLHIHSSLSPCADELNTPNNILNMALLAELDLVAITDHNSVKQLPVIRELSNYFDFLLIPGIELSVDNFHILLYFKTFEDAYDFESEIQKFFYTGDKSINYKQEIFDEMDYVIDEVNYYLHHINLSYKDFTEIKNKYRCVTILAHIDRKSSSALNSYSLEQLDFDGVEISQMAGKNFIEKYRDYRILFNSDSHDITQVGILDSVIELKDKTIESFFEYFGVKNE